MRILIVAENASVNLSGEAFLAIYYFDRLREQGMDVWMVCHERAREDLLKRYPGQAVFERIHFIKDQWIQKAVWRLSARIPGRIRGVTTDEIIRLVTQANSRPVVKKLISQFDIDIIFDPSRISPKAPSFMYNMGVPVVLGPLAGGMNFPPDFTYLESRMNRLSISAGRMLSQFVNRIIPGKLQASALIVSNERTLKALPRGYRGKVYYVRDGGVDLDIWKPLQKPEPTPGEPTRFVCMGRMVEQKGIRFLIEAFKPVTQQCNAVLELIGNGELLDEMKALVARHGIQDKVDFHGWMALEEAAELIADCDVFLVPSVADPGNIALMEAMATGMPTVVTNWGGPGEIADSSCSILVEPSSRKEFVEGFADAMIRLAQSPGLRSQMGKAAIEHMKTDYFSWDAKVNRIIEIFEETIEVDRRSEQLSIGGAS